MQAASVVLPIVQRGIENHNSKTSQNGLSGNGVDYRGIVDRYRGMRPTGYLTPEDNKFADANFQAGAEKVGIQSRNARQRAAGRLSAKGLNLSPASERVNEELNQDESRSLTGLSRNRDATLFGLRTGREGREANMNLQGMLAEISGARDNNNMAMQRRAGFYNSLLELAPEVFDYFGTPKGLAPNQIAGQVVQNNLGSLSTAGAPIQPR
jgi:hypothetical protein